MLKKYCLTFLLIVSSLSSSFSQSEREILKYDNGFSLVYDGNNYGIKKKNKIVVPAFFDTITPLKVGNDYYDFFLVYQNGRMGVFDYKGKMTVPVAFTSVIPFLPNNFLFEIVATDIRAFYITPEIAKMKDMQKADNTILASAFETPLDEWFTVMQYFMDHETGNDFTWKDLIPDTSNMQQKTRYLVRAFLKQQNSDNLYELSYDYYWQNNRSKVNYLLDANTLKGANYKSDLLYPVTGISYEQAKLFCKLKSKMYNSEVNPYYEKYKLAIRFRLPKINEWEEFALSGLSQEMKNNKMLDSINIKKCPLFNYQYNFTCESIVNMKKKYGEGIVAINDFWPSEIGLYNVYGNVAEMIDEKGYCKGGSYFDYAAKSMTNKTRQYNGPQPWLGFRSVAELVVETISYN